MKWCGGSLASSLYAISRTHKWVLWITCIFILYKIQLHHMYTAHIASCFLQPYNAITKRCCVVYCEVQLLQAHTCFTSILVVQLLHSFTISFKWNSVQLLHVHLVSFQHPVNGWDPDCLDVFKNVVVLYNGTLYLPQCYGIVFYNHCANSLPLFRCEKGPSATPVKLSCSPMWKK